LSVIQIKHALPVSVITARSCLTGQCNKKKDGNLIGVIDAGNAWMIPECTVDSSKECIVDVVDTGKTVVLILKVWQYL
jgi:hypothetical protein